jgi:hypothetical protein
MPFWEHLPLLRWKWTQSPATPSRSEVEEFLRRSCPDPAPLEQLRVLIVCVFFRCPDPPETITAYARTWGLNAAKAAELMRGDVEFGFRWPSIEGVLSDCGAAPAHIEVAHDLFHEYPRRDRQVVAPVIPTVGATPVRPPSAEEPAVDPQVLPQVLPRVPPPVPPPVQATEPDIEPDIEVGGLKEPASSSKGHKPDPAQAQTAEELIAMMREFRVWAGKPSYRDMARTSGRYSQASFAGIGKKTTMPRLQLVLAYIEGCDGDSQDLEAWKQAWRRIAMETDVDGNG